MKEAARVARGAGKPVIAFSTDASVAGQGVYLLSFLVESYVERIVDFAAQRGKKSIAALVPENDYGTVALAQFQQSAAEHGSARADDRALQARRRAALGAAHRRRPPSRSTRCSSPSRPRPWPPSRSELQAAHIDTKRIQVLGTGLWNDARVLKLPALQGAWFVAPENAGFNALAQRYRAKFNSDPARIATLAYDAVSLAIALSRSQGSQRYSENVLTNPSGFNGADGVFRFKADGMNERGLSVLEISGGAAKVLSPAPRSFTGNGA